MRIRAGIVVYDGKKFGFRCLGSGFRGDWVGVVIDRVGFWGFAAEGIGCRHVRPKAFPNLTTVSPGFRV